MLQMNKTLLELLERHRALTALPLGMNNARELGGIRLKDGRHVRRGLLLRTTQLFDADAEDLRRLREDYQLSLILDMRGEDEIARAPDPDLPGVRWVATPIIDFAYMKQSIEARLQGHREELPAVDPERFTMEQLMEQMLFLARKTGGTGLGAAYATYLESPLGQEKLGLFFHELAANEHGAALWHCYTGKDRTGIAAGLILEVLGADRATILADYETSNLYFAEQIHGMEQVLRAKGAEEEFLAPLCGLVGVHSSMLEQAWAYMDESWGGPIAYLTDACGVSPEELERLRRRYIEP